jgi:acid phosphatase
MNPRVRIIVPAAVASLLALTALPAAGSESNRDDSSLNKINHIVVIYEENHSFDNLYGGWEGVNGRSAGALGSTQVNQAGTAYTCLMQNDVNLTSPPLSADCTDTTSGAAFTSHFHNLPFSIEAYIPKDARTCPQPGVFAPHGLTPSPTNLPGGCTEDIVHRFYQEQYQLNNGSQNRYTTGSDAVGLTQGYYNTKALPIYKYLHGEDHPNYAIADDFFQAAFGGSFLNHQWLIAAASPTWPGAPLANHSIIDSNGMPNGKTANPSYALYTPTGPVKDAQLTQVCPSVVPGRACGDHAVNTIQPAFQPFKGNPQLPPQTGNTIGDELTGAGVSWAWYSGGWSNANGNYLGPGWTNGPIAGVCGDPNSAPNPSWPYCPNKVFQFHHQPFNYFANYAPATATKPAMPGRAHLQDEQAFIDLAKSSNKTCKLNSVSFVKPIGLENEHPGYTSETRGSSHLVDLLKTIEGTKCQKDTMVVVTYDEFGGQWDHVAPPGQGGTAGPHDQWGPGTRLPTLIIAPRLRGDFVVDHTQYDTTSILATIEHRFGLSRLGTDTRDGVVNDLSTVFRARAGGGGGGGGGDGGGGGGNN